MWLIQRWHATQRWRLSTTTTTIVAADEDDDDATITMTWHALDMHKTYDRPYVCLFVCLSVNSSQTIQNNISCSKLNVAFVLGGFFWHLTNCWQILCAKKCICNHIQRKKIVSIILVIVIIIIIVIINIGFNEYWKRDLKFYWMQCLLY